MDHDDPFGMKPNETGDRTVIRPRPGGKRPAQTPQPATQTPNAPPPLRTTGAPTLPTRQGANKLEIAASSLLSLLGRLRDTPSHSDPATLKNSIIEKFRTFERKAQDLGVDKETTFWARYVLCTAIDEMVLSTPWGNQSFWRDQSLLVSLHNEAWGGEKFFQLLQKLLQNPAKNIELLELMYICLSFGFEGRFRPLPDGYAQLQTIRDNLYRTIRNHHDEYDHDLSSNWKGVYLKQNALVQYVPLWVVLAVSGVLLLLMFFGFNLSLNVKSDPVHAELHNIARNVQTVVERKPPPAPEPELTLRILLANEISQGKVSVEEDYAEGSVSIAGDGLFASGSVDVSDQFLPLLNRIAAAMDKLDGEILVAGHTDNVPIRSLRYPSNWHLSRTRAESVAKIMALDLALPGRVQSEGRGSAEPLTSNDTKEGRARNRRVEITLIKP
ncbi:MAG: type IVB secretion system protein IcmH/DotU [Candidatus Thiodiazotropha sp. (ex Lucinoma borealis)]|nr:type IVB secretion system protein IcmH/DotU [Candidatus Thiodiazotropha sp. (ex Lucinoma borealis)]MCU7840106.1 type IVB secretion system protein IcmH/DotU [Candidatus Thiodiazotropha sp. (ex Troendleina suluensis)]MCU7855325.1 type IVB secretion system protein IcmH/DotU [Candidatus Thiodiazotropha sp. (ex Lucinoma borealis)]MCU7869934.1 type IVB secretion system protein IcmH/DotU [Candidatus Thiodiazotropha sp. (ex Lucinoma borealis)]